MRRVTRRGGTVSAAVWDYAREMTLLRARRSDPELEYAASLPSEHREALKEDLRRRLRVGGQPFTLTARAWAVTGRVG
jgi:hypothetical protein